MAQVVVTIAGRVYRMGCEDGQERHIESLAANLDQKMQELRAAFGEIGEQRLTMMTALTIADELSEVKAGFAGLERQIAELSHEIALSRSGESAQTRQYAAALERAAERIERVTQDLGHVKIGP